MAATAAVSRPLPKGAVIIAMTGSQGHNNARVIAAPVKDAARSRIMGAISRQRQA